MNLSDDVSKALRGKELVLAIVQLSALYLLLIFAFPLHPKHLLQDVDVIRDPKQIPTILIREQIVKLVETRPSNAA